MAMAIVVALEVFWQRRKPLCCRCLIGVHKGKDREVVGGSPEGALKLPMDGSNVEESGGEDRQGDSQTSLPSLLGIGKRRMDDSLPSIADSVLPSLKKQKSSSVKKGKDKKTSKNMKRREVGGIGKVGESADDQAFRC